MKRATQLTLALVILIILIGFVLSGVAYADDDPPSGTVVYSGTAYTAIASTAVPTDIMGTPISTATSPGSAGRR